MMALPFVVEAPLTSTSNPLTRLMSLNLPLYELRSGGGGGAGIIHQLAACGIGESPERTHGGCGPLLIAAAIGLPLDELGSIRSRACRIINHRAAIRIHDAIGVAGRKGRTTGPSGDLHKT